MKSQELVVFNLVMCILSIHGALHVSYMLLSFLSCQQVMENIGKRRGLQAVSGDNRRGKNKNRYTRKSCLLS